MKLFLDTADVTVIREWIKKGIIDGVTTNPTHLSKQTKDPITIIHEISALLPHGEISVEVTQSEPDDVYRQARKIAEIGTNILVKIPCHERYYATIKQLISDNIPLNITLLFSITQGFLMAKLGVAYISPFVGRLEDNGCSGVSLLHELTTMMKQYGYQTKVLAASLRSLEHIKEALVAGTDAATVPVDLLKKMTEHPLTQKGMDIFAHDWASLKISKFP